MLAMARLVTGSGVTYLLKLEAVTGWNSNIGGTSRVTWSSRF